MAPISGLLSYQIQDADTEIGSLDINFTTASGLLADVVSFINALTPAIDVVIDGKILKVRLTLNIPLPSGLKATPTAGGELERTALFSMQCANTINTHGLDVPSWAQTDFSLNQVLSSGTGVAAFEALLLATTNTTVMTDRYGNAFTAIKRAAKTFRKHRKALRKA